MIVTIEGHPATLLLLTSALVTIKTALNNDIVKDIRPKKVIIVNGTVEKDTTPVTAYFVNDQNDHDVFPATRSRFSNGMYFVLKPTQVKIPLLKR